MRLDFRLRHVSVTVTERYQGNRYLQSLGADNQPKVGGVIYLILLISSKNAKEQMRQVSYSFHL